jgi:hypothetical protein
MERTPVTSSNVIDVGYDADSQTLEVGFKNGSVYQYNGVPPSEHEALMNAASTGTYLAANIKGRYSYIKL